MTTNPTDGSTTGPIDGECPDDPDLVACYTFEDRGAGGDELIDGSAYGNDGTANAVNYIAGPFGDALDHGPEGQVTIPESEDLDIAGPLTLEAWVNPSDLSETRNVIENDTQYRLLLRTDGVSCRKPGEEVVFNTALEVSEWAHIACRYDSGTADLFIHGVLESTQTWTDLGVDGTFGTAIGNALPDYTVPFVGQIDTVRIWSRALSDEEIAASAVLAD